MSYMSYIINIFDTNDVINLKRLPIAKRINYHQLKLAHKAIYEKTFPNYLKLAFKNRNKRLRKIKNDEFKRLTCKDNTFHGSSCSVFYRFICSGYAVQPFRIICSLFRIPDLSFRVPYIAILAFRILPQPQILGNLSNMKLDLNVSTKVKFSANDQILSFNNQGISGSLMTG